MRTRVPTFAAIVSFTLPVWAIAGSTSPTTNPVIDLTAKNAPALSPADAVDALPEGTHVVGRTGRLVHSSDGQQAILVFDADTPAPSSPMILLPNLNLTLMEGVTTNKTVDFRVSGTVTEYKGRNYLLVDNLPQTTLNQSTIPAAPAPVLSQNHKPAPSLPLTEAAPPPHVTVAAPGEPVASKMDRLLSSSPSSGQEIRAVLDNTPTTNAVTGKAAVAPDAPLLKVVREGTHFINRTGRLNHTPDGQKAIFTFDADGKTMADPPMVILPNLKLLSMEGQVLGRAGDLHFRVSGTITEYKGRNFILLDKAVAMADVETQF